MSQQANPCCDCFHRKHISSATKTLRGSIHLSSPNPSLQSFTTKTRLLTSFFFDSFRRDFLSLFFSSLPSSFFQSHSLMSLFCRCRSHRERCERVFFVVRRLVLALDQQNSAAFASYLRISPKCCVGLTLENIEKCLYTHMLAELVVVELFCFLNGRLVTYLAV